MSPASAGRAFEAAGIVTHSRVERCSEPLAKRSIELRIRSPWIVLRRFSRIATGLSNKSSTSRDVSVDDECWWSY